MLPILFYSSIATCLSCFYRCRSSHSSGDGEYGWCRLPKPEALVLAKLLLRFTIIHFWLQSSAVETGFWNPFGQKILKSHDLGGLSRCRRPSIWSHIYTAQCDHCVRMKPQGHAAIDSRLEIANRKNCCGSLSGIVFFSDMDFQKYRYSCPFDLWNPVGFPLNFS